MADDFADLSRKIGQLQDSLDGTALRRMTSRVAVQAKKDIEQELSKAVGGDRKMSNWRPKLSAGFEMQGDAAVMKPRPSGPWKVLNDGAKPHRIAPKKRSKSSVLSTPFGFRASVQHPGSRGKSTWDHAVTVIKRETPGRVHKEVRRVLGEVF